MPSATVRFRRVPSWVRIAIALAVSVTLKALIVVLHLWPAQRLLSVVLFTTPDIWILTGVLIPNARWIFPAVTRFSTAAKEVWLTIDDGPEPRTTLRMLDLLDRHNARATFFVIGRKAKTHPELIAEIVRRGHTLGNHTLNHPVATFWLAGPGRTRREFEGCQAILEAIGGGRARYFRPPAGIRSYFVHHVLAVAHCTFIGWSARGREQLAGTTEVPLRRLKRRISPGGILLVHESDTHAEHRIGLLDGLLDHLSANGYRCVLPEESQLTE